jgi:hypothetical protein
VPAAHRELGSSLRPLALGCWESCSLGHRSVVGVGDRYGPDLRYVEGLASEMVAANVVAHRT